MSSLADMQDTYMHDTSVSRRTGGVPGFADWEVVLWDMAFVQAGEGKGAGQEDEGFVRAGGVSGIGDFT